MSARADVAGAALARLPAALAWLPLALAGCATVGGSAPAPKLPPANPEAVEAFRDGVRHARLGPGSFERALERLHAAEELDQNLWEAWFDDGWIEMERRRPAQAIHSLEEALRRMPTHEPAVALLHEAYLATGRAADAAAVDRAYLARVSDEAAALPVRLLLSAALRRMHKLDEATDVLRRVLRAQPRSTAALDGLALVYAERGQHELADLVLHRALDTLGACATSRASCACEEGKACEPARAAAETLSNLGLTALARRRDQEAFAYFDRASRLDPSLTVIRRNKATVYLDCGDYGRAVDELKWVTRTDPSDQAAWIALGVAERGAGAIDAAARAYEQAINQAAGSDGAADAHYDLGVLYMDFKKNRTRAKDEFEQFLKTAPASHSKRADAEARIKEIAPASAGVRNSTETKSAPRSQAQSPAPSSAQSGRGKR